jgi:hypothetical protein
VAKSFKIESGSTFGDHDQANSHTKARKLLGPHVYKKFEIIFFQAFHMLQTGRRDLIPHALQLLPPGEKVNAANSSGWFQCHIDQ